MTWYYHSCYPRVVVFSCCQGCHIAMLVTNRYYLVTLPTPSIRRCHRRLLSLETSLIVNAYFSFQVFAAANTIKQMKIILEKIIHLSLFPYPNVPFFSFTPLNFSLCISSSLSSSSPPVVPHTFLTRMTTSASETSRTKLRIPRQQNLNPC